MTFSLERISDLTAKAASAAVYAKIVEALFGYLATQYPMADLVDVEAEARRLAVEMASADSPDAAVSLLVERFGAIMDRLNPEE